MNLAPDMSKFKLKERSAPLAYPRPALEIDECIPFTYGQIHQFAAEMKQRGIKARAGALPSRLRLGCGYLIDHDLIEKPYWMQTVMGYQTGSFPTGRKYSSDVERVSRGCLWLCSAIGPFQLPLTTLATLMGGHVRVGLEDNVIIRADEKQTSNAELVKRSVRIAHELNREISHSVAGPRNVGPAESSRRDIRMRAAA